MSDDSTPPPEPKKKPKHFSLLRSFALADFITLTNGACGMGAVLLSMSYVDEPATFTMWLALGLLPVALLADVADGSVARWRRSSPFGADLDSLADVVSFGVAPSALAFALGMRGGWDGLIFVYFVGCGISRLARFNVTAPELMTEGGKVSHFEGTPIPTSLLLVAVLAAAYGTGHVGDALWFGVFELGPFELHPLALMFFVSGSAMASATLRVPKP